MDYFYFLFYCFVFELNFFLFYFYWLLFFCYEMLMFLGIRRFNSFGFRFDVLFWFGNWFVLGRIYDIMGLKRVFIDMGIFFNVILVLIVSMMCIRRNYRVKLFK